MTKTSARRSIYRNIALMLVRCGAVLAVALVLLLGMLLYAFTTFPRADTTSRAAAAVMVLIAAMLIWMAIRIVGSRISADQDGVFVHTVFRPCKYISWDDITGFELVPARRLNNQFTRSAVAIAVMRTSERIRSTASGPASPNAALPPSACSKHCEPATTAHGPSPAQPTTSGHAAAEFRLI